MKHFSTMTKYYYYYYYYNQVQYFRINDLANHYVDIKITGQSAVQQKYCRQGRS